MRFLKLSIPVAAVMIAAPVNAEERLLHRGPAPAWAETSQLLEVPADADGLIYVRRQDTLVHLDQEGQWNYSGQTVRILNSQALQLGNLVMTWNPASGTPIVHTVRIHRGSEVIDVLQSTDFEILRREDQLEQAMLDGLLTAVLRVPDLRVGDDLEFDFTIPGHDPTLGNSSYGMLFLAATPPQGKFKLGLSWENGQEPKFVVLGDLKEHAVRSAGALTITLDNPGVANLPKDAPPRYNWSRIVEYSDFADWPAVSRRYHQLFSEAIQLEANSAIRQEAARIAATHETPLARAQAALELVQEQVRYIYVGLNGGNSRPATADETWSRRYGDCKGKTALLLALLRELGISAEPVLVNNDAADDGFNERLPNPGLFDHVLVRAIIDGKSIWMDGTLPVIAKASEEPAIPYRWVLPLTSKGAALENQPWEPFALPQEMGLFEIDARAGFDQPAKKIQTSVKRGVDALVEYVQFSAVSKNQLENALRSQLTGSSGWDVIDNVEYRFDLATGASILKIVGSGPVDWQKGRDGAYSLVLPGGGFYPPSRHQRAQDQDQTAPYFQQSTYSCHVTTVRLPEATKVENWAYNSLFDTMLYGRLYYRVMERGEDGSIRMVRGSRVNEQEISAARAERDNGRLADFDNSTARIYYVPDEAQSSWEVEAGVPATYELDWTGENVPCLPPDELAN